MIARDITADREAMRALETSRRHLAESQRFAHVGSFELDLVTHHLSWSAEHFRVPAIDPELKPTSELFTAMVHPDDLATVTHALADVIDQGISFDLVFRIIRGDSVERWFRGRGEAGLDQGGTVIKLLGTLMDETEWVEASRTRREAEERFEIAFEQAGSAPDQ